MTARTLSKILIAALATSLIVLGRIVIRPFIQEETAYMPFLAAVLVTAYLAGSRAGLLATGMSLLTANYFFVAPPRQFVFTTWDHVLQAIIFVALGILTCLVVGAVQRSRIQAEVSSQLADAQQRQLEHETSERLRILGDLRDTEAQFQQLADTLPHMVWVARPDGYTMHINDRWTAYTGMSVERSLGNGWLAAMHPEDRRPASLRWRAARDTGQPYETECRFRSKTGQYQWFLSRALPVRDRAGKIVKWFGTSTDIDAQKRSGQELAHQLTREHKQRTLIKEVADASLTIHSARSLREVLEVVVEEARLIIGANIAIGSLTISDDWRQVLQAASFSDKYDQWRGRTISLDAAGIYSIVCQTQRPIRLSREHLHSHPDLAAFHSLEEHPPLQGWLATALMGRDGQNLGVLQLSDKEGGEFTEDDESVLLQLASIAAVAIENVRLLQAMQVADARKDEFLALLAHELRNPLAPIRNSLQVLQTQNASPEDANRSLRVMERQVEQMVRLIDDLLDIARINRGKMTLRRAPLDLVEVLQNAIDASRPLIDSMSHTLQTSIPKEKIPVFGDMTRLTQVFQNLLNNAAKYTEPHGQISLTALVQQDEVLVQVSDNGIGIPEAVQSEIFEMFTQVDRSLERTRGGLGIGLTLVHTLVQLHGGSIAVSSSGVAGEGSQFIVRLPLSDIVEESTSPHDRHDPIEKSQQRVVVVDDNVDSAESLGRLLELMGHEVRLAHDGLTALDLITTYLPETIFLDIGLPNLNGYEVAKRLRADSRLDPKMRIVALTGWGQDGDRQKSREAGFNFHLTKPADPDRIVEIMAGVTANDS